MTKNNVFTKGNWTRTPNSFIQRQSRISKRCVDVFSYLCSSVDGGQSKKTGKIIVSRSQPVIATKIGISLKTVKRAVADLITLGYLKVEKRRWNGYNDYEILDGLSDAQFEKALGKVNNKARQGVSHLSARRVPPLGQDVTPYQDVVTQDVVSQDFVGFFENSTFDSDKWLDNFFGINQENEKTNKGTPQEKNFPLVKDPPVNTSSAAAKVQKFTKPAGARLAKAQADAIRRKGMGYEFLRGLITPQWVKIENGVEIPFEGA